MSSYNITMKTELEIEIKKIRKKLKVHDISDEERVKLRRVLVHLKSLHKAEKRTLTSN